MNKKGLTLVELIAVIAILGILSVIVTPGIIAMSNRIKQNTLDSKISEINVAALDYGSDYIMELPSPLCSGSGADESAYSICEANAKKCYEEKGTSDNCLSYCRLIPVKTLIDLGYLAGDNDSSRNDKDDIEENANRDIVNYKTNIYNPVTGESMNDEMVCIRFDSDEALKRKMVSYILGEDELGD